MVNPHTQAIVDGTHFGSPYQTGNSRLLGSNSVISNLHLGSLISEERENLDHALDQLGGQYGRNSGLTDKPGFSYIMDALFTQWTSNSNSLSLTDENIHTLHSHFRPFIPERQDGELLEGVHIILGPPHHGFIQFFNYVVNLISNNLVSGDDIYKVVGWIDETRAHGLLLKLLGFKLPTITAFASNLLPGALRRNNASITRILLDAGVNPNLPMGYSRENALQYATKIGNIGLVRILLNAGADVNAPAAGAGYKERTALQEAAWKGHIELVRILLSAGADVNAPATGIDGHTALQAVAEGGHIELARILLDAGADVNAPAADYRGRTAVQAAAGKGNIELVQILLDANADINAPPGNNGGVTALQAAAIRGHIKAAQLLLEAGANVNAAPAIFNGRTALEGAAEHGRIDLLQLLINAGADTNSLQRTRAQKYAATQGHSAVCGLLEALVVA